MGTAWPGAAVTPLLPSRIPTGRKTCSSTRKTVLPSYERLTPKFLRSTHASSKKVGPRVREDSQRNRQHTKKEQVVKA